MPDRKLGFYLTYIDCLQGVSKTTAITEIVGLDRTASEVMALMSRSSSQSLSQAPGGVGAGPQAGKAAPARPQAGGGLSAARFSVFGKNLTNMTAAAASATDQQQVRVCALC